jgi:hypothetical protein
METEKTASLAAAVRTGVDMSLRLRHGHAATEGSDREAAVGSEKRFADALFEGFNSPSMARRIEELNRPAYAVGDGTRVGLGDGVRVPAAVGGLRAGEWGEVVKLGRPGGRERDGEAAQGQASIGDAAEGLNHYQA